jgi:hypothetical protein
MTKDNHAQARASSLGAHHSVSCPFRINPIRHVKKKCRDIYGLIKYVLSDMVTKATNVCLVAAAFVFIAMLLMTGMHP